LEFLKFLFIEIPLIWSKFLEKAKRLAAQLNGASRYMYAGKICKIILKENHTEI